MLLNFKYLINLIIKIEKNLINFNYKNIYYNMNEFEFLERIKLVVQKHKKLENIDRNISVKNHDYEQFLNKLFEEIYWKYGPHRSKL